MAGPGGTGELGGALLIQDERAGQAPDRLGSQPRGTALLKIPHDADAHLSQLGHPWTITSEPQLQPNDSRISGPVSVTHGPHGIRLWTALDAAVTPDGAPAPQDAAAWFEINPVRPRVVRQGYVTAPVGDSLLFPALAVGRFGPAAMTFTISSATMNPGAAFTTLGSHAITIAAEGNGPHQSFSDAPPFDNARWGDYSFAVPDPDNGGVWLATEYIPPAAFQAEVDNWGTEVFEVARR